MADKKNISSQKTPVEKDMLKDFLKDNLSEDMLQSIDNNSQDDAFLQDAMEGLESFSSTDKIRQNMQQLNKKLRISTQSKRKNSLIDSKQLFWFILAVAIIILLVMLAYEVISLRK